MAKKKFTAIEKDVTDAPVAESKIDLEWEGEHIDVQSTTHLEDDKGTGQETILRFFKFAANPEIFKQHKPTAQELFNHCRRGMESLLWTDGLTPHQGIEPRLIFDKDGKSYSFAITCLPREVLLDKSQTLTEILH